MLSVGPMFKKHLRKYRGVFATWQLQTKREKNRFCKKKLCFHRVDQHKQEKRHYHILVQVIYILQDQWTSKTKLKWPKVSRKSQ